MTGEDLLPWLMSMGTNPLAIAFAILVATFVLEDAATVGAALLALSGAIPDSLALGALYCGIFLGDIALYGLGAAARWHTGIRSWIGSERIARGQEWLNQRLTWALIGARFVPGLRLPTYTASGYLQISFTHFAVIAACAAGIWTTAIFYLVKAFGAPVAAMLGPWAYLAGGIILLAVFFASPILAWWRARRARH